jgi:thermostable 8-oxoguanine DNA glycosylase
MINPTNITNYNRNQRELEEFLMFCIMVAGKSAKQTAQKLNLFLSKRENNESPLEYVDALLHEELGINLEQAMRNGRLGQYGRLKKAFAGILKFQGHLHEVSVEDLESINGIGPKTARFFILHSRKNARHAVLDTHILKWLKLHGENAPKSTPSGNKYIQLENRFLQLANDYNMSVADLDLSVWKQYSQK